MSMQRRWQRNTLLTVLGYEGLGALAGGATLIAGPDGHLMNMPVAVMHGTFNDFLLPGFILFAMGALNVLAFVVVLRRLRSAWLAAGVANVGMIIWFLVEIAVLRQLHWLHAMWGLPVALGAAVTVPLLPARRPALGGQSPA
jgi:hypothetical protein